MNDETGRLRNCRNRHQGSFPKALCVCSAGLLRSPTLAWVLSNPPYNCNVRVVGVRPELALIQVDKVLLHWADHVVCVNKHERELLDDYIEKSGADTGARVWELQLPDNFQYRDPELVAMIEHQLDEIGFPEYQVVKYVKRP